MGDPWFSPVKAAKAKHARWVEQGLRHYRVDWIRGDELVGALLCWASDEIDLGRKIAESGTAYYVNGDPGVRMSMVDCTDGTHGMRCPCSRCAAYSASFKR